MSRRQTRALWRRRLRGESSPGPALAPRRRLPVAAVSVRIDELSLKSFSQRDGRRIADALQQELSSLLAGGGVPDAWLRGQPIERAHLSDIRIRAGAKAQIVGEQLARALLRAGDGSQRR
jgi:hypothetical protein